MRKSQQHDVELGARRARERRILRAGFLISLAIHVLIMFLSPVARITISSAAGPGRDARAAAGIAEVVALASAPPDVPVVVTVTEPIVVPEEPEIFIPVPVIEDVPLPTVDEVGVGDSSGDDAQDVGQAGVADEDGAGGGGDDLVGPPAPPRARGLFIPPQHDALRGREIAVSVFVNAEGRVVADSTRIEPPTSDRRLNERLASDAAQWRFDPARENGQPIAAWFVYTIEQ